MPIETGEYLTSKNIYINYEYELVMFRIDKASNKIYKKFYGKPESLEAISDNNRLFNDALLYGEEITLDEYMKFKNIDPKMLNE